MQGLVKSIVFDTQINQKVHNQFNDLAYC